jgi:Tfp pilus assembly protein PilF
MLTKENGFTLPVNLNFPDGKKYAFTFISLLIILLAIYSNSFYGEWHFDDFANIVNNPHIQVKSFSWDGIKNCFYGLEQERPSRPLAYLSFAINYYLDGENVFGYHLVNFIIHYLASVFLFLFIYNTLQLPLLREKYSSIAYPIAMLATFFWAVNPVHVTSVTYIVQRMASMTALFYIMSMYFYLKARTNAKLIYSIIFFIFSTLCGLAAILTKENAAMLPVGILLYDLFLIQGINKNNIKKYLKIAILPLTVILIIGFIYIDFPSIWGGYKMRNFTMMQRILTEPRVIIFYLSLLFYPINSRLTLLYDTEVSRSLFHPWTTTPAILLIFIIIGFVLYIVKKRPLISFCIIFYFLNHIIEGTIFSLELIYEHRNYLPSMLLFIPIAEFIIYAIDYLSCKKSLQYVASCTIVIFLVGMGYITYIRNEIVGDDFKLWVDNSNKYPKLSRPHSNLGNAYIKDQQKAKGLEQYNIALELNNFGGIYARAIQEYNLGLYYFQEQKYSQALPYFKSSYKVLNYYLPNPIYISKIKLINNKISEAHSLIEEQIEKYPDNSDLIELFSLILYKEGNLDKAEATSKNAIKNNSSSTFHLMILAETARKKGNFRAAISLWKLYQQSFPQDSYANLALIELYAQTNNYKSLDEEIAKLYCLKGNKTLISYLKEISQDKNLRVYIPDVVKMKSTIENNKQLLIPRQNFN